MSTLSRRRNIDEIAQRYLRNPNLKRDIYVEGKNDKHLIELYLKRNNDLEAAVYSIDTVDVPDELLVDAGLNPGSCRNRLIVLKEHLFKKGVKLADQRFIIDRDQEDVCPTGPLINGMNVTDLGTLEVSVMHTDSLGRLVETFCRDSFTANAFESLVFSIARELYLIRGAAKRLKLPIKILEPNDFISLSGSGMRFDFEGYLDRVVVASNSKASLEALKAEIASCKQEIESANLAHNITANDHDIYLIIFRILRLSKVLANRSEADVRSHLLMAIDYNFLDAQKVFQSVLKN